ncbi:Armadillo repeat protein deleted in velo-cardio-facial syndrome, partial [Ophiophagus hannah]
MTQHSVQGDTLLFINNGVCSCTACRHPSPGSRTRGAQLLCNAFTDTLRDWLASSSAFDVCWLSSRVCVFPSPRLFKISQSSREMKAASHVLQMTWSYKELRNVLQKEGWNKSHFQVRKPVHFVAENCSQELKTSLDWWLRHQVGKQEIVSSSPTLDLKPGWLPDDFVSSSSGHAAVGTQLTHPTTKGSKSTSCKSGYDDSTLPLVDKSQGLFVRLSKGLIMTGSRGQCVLSHSLNQRSPNFAGKRGTGPPERWARTHTHAHAAQLVELYMHVYVRRPATSITMHMHACQPVACVAQMQIDHGSGPRVGDPYPKSLK